MAFLRFFDFLDFNDQGKVCETKKFDINSARANFLYLISKYNQKFIKEKNFSSKQKIELPKFFTEELNLLLSQVEAGLNYEIAKNKVAQNCLPEVQLLITGSKNDRDLIERLNEQMKISTNIFAKNQSKIVNNLALSYIITLMLGKLDESIEQNLQFLNDPKRKSEAFKKMIDYNALSGTLEKVEKNIISWQDVIKQVG